ncbi:MULTISPECIES: type I-B CRISPR-associated protein Cas8b1/Cst1 [Thermodesulfovibrio]|uniref:CRISPR-associated CXXC_CXXC protein Cst1 n=1 Tax=Thermodesulfovibrio yellowstonii (strain ATCC 51303 / DSM 11347 / YP87) TaxID=289376 RepID=B5YIV5_THEYD|nr:MULTISPECIES: type I-B CRISPR-associated protein Cas8b1/Cst1 [Thermodesulfovibrio]ACI21434.1 CRISPR-associated CXXC_CXXC protein Cst1 [Thermodesulfovibrio yellowstonii DSM 11347]MDI6864468.1 type I-B CRISPR-associated protein Cas8b1/Cst1 [Thermodesulfovibrio yellowstonii]
MVNDSIKLYPSTVKHKIYMRDWYFNAGIVGFLNIITDGKELDSIPYLTIGENYIEFSDEIFEGFEEKFSKYAFLKFFNVNAYLQRLQKAQKDLTEKKTKIKPEQIRKKLEEIEKPPYKDFLKLLNIPVWEYKSAEDFIDNLEKAQSKLKNLSKNQIFEILNKTPEGKESIQIFINQKLKGVCSHENVSEYVSRIKAMKYSKKLKNNELCPSCQEKKAEYEFNNAVSNIIGFNKDNSNWIWGFKVSKLQICPLCAIIYSCAFASFAYVLKIAEGEYLNYFYFPNENTNLKTLYEIVKTFNLLIDNIEENSNLLYVMIKQIVDYITKKQINRISENINFIEIADNPILAGQGTKGYNIYNYNISPDIAMFLDLQFKNESVPKGYYVLNKNYCSIEEELLKLAISYQIDYSTLYRYFAYYLDTDNYSTKYNLNKVMNFVIKYIQWVRGESMEKSQKIINKGYLSGLSLRNELIKKGKENQINGLVYGFLNDLKIGDREKFLDKYLRIVMSHNQPNRFGKDEMLDDDYFLQFGYSFVSGLISKSGIENNTGTNDIEEE